MAKGIGVIGSPGEIQFLENSATDANRILKTVAHIRVKYIKNEALFLVVVELFGCPFEADNEIIFQGFDLVLGPREVGIELPEIGGGESLFRVCGFFVVW